MPVLLGGMAGIGKQATGAGDAPLTLALAVFHLIGLCYVVWLNWFLVRYGLDVSAIRAGIAVALLVMLMSFADYARIMLAGPSLVITTFRN